MSYVNMNDELKEIFELYIYRKQRMERNEDNF